MKISTTKTTPTIRRLAYSAAGTGVPPAGGARAGTTAQGRARRRLPVSRPVVVVGHDRDRRGGPPIRDANEDRGQGHEHCQRGEQDRRDGEQPAPNSFAELAPGDDRGTWQQPIVAQPGAQATSSRYAGST